MGLLKKRWGKLFSFRVRSGKKRVVDEEPTEHGPFTEHPNPENMRHANEHEELMARARSGGAL